jgi:pimeloyl-ACP methyl ester carboxylesterase
MKVAANGLHFEVLDSAEADPSHLHRPPVLLVMGLGMQLIAWPSYFVQPLLDAGLRVICFDNRDCGLSDTFDTLGKPNMPWAMLRFQMGLALHPPYTLADMAQDSLGVLDALGLRRAHVVGISMGGMIAQRMAAAAPQRVISLASIMSSSGAKGLPGPQPHAMKAMMSRPRNKTEDAVTEYGIAFLRAVGSQAYPMPEADLRAQVQQSFRRSLRPHGVLRQTLAVMADTERAALLSHITCPTLVVHGRADPLVPFACGEDTASRIAGSVLLGIDGLGHDLPPEPVHRMLAALIPHIQFAQQRAA